MVTKMFRELIKRYKLAIALLGDILVFILSLAAVLYARYGNDGFATQFAVHKGPMLAVLIIWLIIFHIGNLYTYKAFSNILEITRQTVIILAISFFITITIFYIFSRFFELTPKANLVAFTIVFGILDIAWRYLLRKIFLWKSHRSNVLVLASSPLLGEIQNHVLTHPQLGYSIQIFNAPIDTLRNVIKKDNVNMIVVNGQYLKNHTVAQTLYRLLPKQVEITTLADFYESLFGCIPLSELEEEWFIREMTKNKGLYDSAKRLTEVVLICLSLPITFPLAALIGLCVLVTSRGPVIYRQERIGKNNNPFTLYKFRTMKDGQTGPLWTEKNDQRITFVGKFLRRTHLDEMPQLVNVLKNDISFIGPRPERSKLVKTYEQIPYYEVRHIIKPGIIGWAQLNYKASTSLDEAKIKFQYDLYYLKNRSFILDLFILIKTIRKFF